MDGNRLQELVQADLDGELSATERGELARLLLRDPDARRLHQEFRKTDELLRGVPKAEPPPGLRAAILAAPALSGRPADPGHRHHHGWSHYRVAAAILGGLLIVGISYLVRDGNSPGTDLQGSLSAAGRTRATGLVAPQDQLSMRAAGGEVTASLWRDGERLSLELDSSTTIPCEVIARIDGAATTFVGNSGDAQLTAMSDQVTVRLATGSQTVVLNFSGVAPIQLQLRAGGRLLGEGRLAVSDP
jgi:hypothetical protein